MRLPPIDLMAGLERCTKKDFVKIFAKKYAESRQHYLEMKSTVEKQLTYINRRYKIENYHNKGFIFQWNEVTSDEGKINWGKFRSSFNIDDPCCIITTGGNYECKAFGYENGGIHLNIYHKHTYFNLPSVVNGNISSICLSYEQKPIVKNFTNRGLLLEVLQVCQNMFDDNNMNDGMGGLGYFKFKQCEVCDEYILNSDKELCPACDERVN